MGHTSIPSGKTNKKSYISKLKSPSSCKDSGTKNPIMPHKPISILTDECKILVPTYNDAGSVTNCIYWEKNSVVERNPS